MLTKKLLLAGAVALVAAGLAAPAAPAYPVDPGGDRLVAPMASRTSAGVAKPKPTKSNPARPKTRPKPPLEP
jgi:hypothetical protein